jgi:hypothetical protein
MLLPPLRAYGPGTRSAPSRLTEVTGIFTTALPMRRIDNRTVRWGTGDLGVSDINSDASLRDEPEPWRAAALAGATSTVRESRAGVEPACAMVRSIRHLHHQRRLSRVIRGRPNDKIVLSRRFARCAAIANPLRFVLSSVSGSRLVPSDRPRALGHALFRREPRDPGLPFRPGPGCFCSYEPRFRTTKSPPERLAREGSHHQTSSVRLSEISPLSRARAIDWREAIR